MILLPQDNYKDRSKKNRYAERQDFKYDLDRKFVKELGAVTIIDAYAGTSNRYASMKLEVMSNDLDNTCNTNYHLCADRFLNLIHGSGMTADVVDLDPYASCWHCLPTAIKLANKGLVVTYTDYTNWRFHRTAVIERQIGTRPKNWEEYRIGLILATIDMAEVFAKKKLRPIYLFEPTKTFLRVYYLVTDKK
jgi:hypothetical protein